MLVKAVLKLDLHDDKEKKKVIKIASGFGGVDSFSIDMKDKKLTVVGEMDLVKLMGKLRKLFRPDLISVEPAKRAHPPPLYNYGRYVNSLNDLASLSFQQTY